MVRKREDGRWEGRIVVGHKKNGDPIHRYVLARTQKELIVKLHDCIEMYRDADLTEDSNMTLGEWLDRWINEYMIFTIRESTLNSYKAMIKNQIKPYTHVTTDMQRNASAIVGSFMDEIMLEGDDTNR